MKAFKSIQIFLLVLSLSLLAASLTTACSGSSSGMTRSSVHYGAGYRGYYQRPWGYPPAYIGGGIDPDWGGDQPVAAQLPEMGMPDFDDGGMDMDFGGDDW